jgi:uncharacterized Zn finger protein (UPF0148 family)
MTAQETTVAEPEQPSFCTSRCAGTRTNEPCPECGHLAALHVGVEHCPVCELVHHNRQVRAALAMNRFEVHVTGVDERVVERVIERMSLRSGQRSPGRYRR